MIDTSVQKEGPDSLKNHIHEAVETDVVIKNCIYDKFWDCRALSEAVAMTTRLLGSSKTLPEEYATELQNIVSDVEAGHPIKVSELTHIHNKLSELIQPAIPNAVGFLAIQKVKHPKLGFLGPVPLIRRMVVVSIISLLSFIAISSLELVSPEVLEADLLYRGGKDQLAVSFFLLSSAAVGACFANLFRAYRYVKEGSYDPELDMTYWIRIILGLIAGYILAELVEFELDSNFGKPLLALLGGFSASAVFKILERIVQALETIVQGDLRNILKSKEQEISAKLEKQATKQKADLATQLMEIRSAVSQNGDPNSAAKEIDNLVKNIFKS